MLEDVDCFYYERVKSAAGLIDVKYCLDYIPDPPFARIVGYRDWETDRKSTRLNSSHSAKSRMPSSA